MKGAAVQGSCASDGCMVGLSANRKVRQAEGLPRQHRKVTDEGSLLLFTAAGQSGQRRQFASRLCLKHHNGHSVSNGIVVSSSDLFTTTFFHPQSQPPISYLI